jgi:hypothetical protein
MQNLISEINAQGPLDIPKVQSIVGQQGSKAIRDAGGIPKLCAKSPYFKYVDGKVDLRDSVDQHRHGAPAARQDSRPQRYANFQASVCMIGRHVYHVTHGRRFRSKCCHVF